VADDIVSRISCAGHAYNDILICPANKYLCGTRYPYFPIGGPVPDIWEKSSSMESSRWGGASAGSMMHYPAQCVDGRVHLEGGAEFQETMKSLIKSRMAQQLHPGESILSIATGQLKSAFHYKYIIHTVPPFLRSKFPSVASSISEFHGKDNPELLASCYASSLLLASTQNDISTVATPLIGAGTAGFSEKDSISALAEALGNPAFLGASDCHLDRREIEGPISRFTLRVVLRHPQSAIQVAQALA
jgi:O-acetyl-ADP-ribose deacetylase (regulator of RNase III)